MIRQIKLIICASTTSVLAFSALAQDTPNPTKDRSSIDVRDGLSHARRADRLNGAAKASDVIGMTVKNYQEETLGKVEDLALDVESGRVVQVIVSTGGFVGMGDTLTAVPPGALHYDVAHQVLHLDVNKEKLKGAPKFEMSKWAEYSDPARLSDVYRHYGEEPAFTFIQPMDATKDGRRVMDASPSRDVTRKAEKTGDKDRLSRESQSMIPVSRLGQLQKGSELMGMSVKNLQDEKLGKVENILVDLPAGRVVAFVVASGGFLGMGDELSAVPPTALRLKERNTLLLDASKEMLGNAPHFQAKQWPDFAQPTYAGGIYRAYNVEPYFNTDMTKEADNTARNVRDRDARALTPLDQGSSPADVDTTARIRKEIIAGENMSVNAKNVKIITRDGRVTLRGPVNSGDEKRIIGEIAGRIARAENVDNQLEVKSTASVSSN